MRDSFLIESPSDVFTTKHDRKLYRLLGFLGIFLLTGIALGTVGYFSLLQKAQTAETEAAALRANLANVQGLLEKMTVRVRRVEGVPESCGLVCRHGGTANRQCTACNHCDAGWHGELCDVPEQCEPVKCIHGKVDGDSCRCTCAFAWKGEYCEVRDDSVSNEDFRKWLTDNMNAARTNTTLNTRVGASNYETAVGMSVHTAKGDHFTANILQLSHNDAGQFYALGDNEALLFPSTSVGPLMVAVNPSALIVPEVRRSTGQNLNEYVAASMSFGSGFRSELANEVQKASYHNTIVSACGPDYSYLLEEQSFPFFHLRLPYNTGDDGYSYELDPRFENALQAAFDDYPRLRELLTVWGDSVVVESYEGAWMFDVKPRTENPERSCQQRFQQCRGGTSTSACPVPKGELNAWLRSSMRQPGLIKYRTEPLYRFVKDPAIRRAMQIVQQIILDGQSTLAASLCMPCSGEGSCEAPSLHCTCTGPQNGASCGACPPGLLLHEGRCRRAERHTFQVDYIHGESFKNLGRSVDHYSCFSTPAFAANYFEGQGPFPTVSECSVVNQGGYWHLRAWGDNIVVKCYATCFAESG